MWITTRWTPWVSSIKPTTMTRTATFSDASNTKSTPVGVELSWLHVSLAHFWLYYRRCSWLWSTWWLYLSGLTVEGDSFIRSFECWFQSLFYAAFLHLPYFPQTNARRMISNVHLVQGELWQSSTLSFSPCWRFSCFWHRHRVNLSLYSSELKRLRSTKSRWWPSRIHENQDQKGGSQNQNGRTRASPRKSQQARGINRCYEHLVSDKHLLRKRLRIPAQIGACHRKGKQIRRNQCRHHHLDSEMHLFRKRLRVYGAQIKTTKW